MTASLKYLVKNTLFTLGSVPGLRPLRRRLLAARGYRAAVVVYHRINDEIINEPEQLTIDRETFAGHLRLYRRHFHVVSLAELVRTLGDGPPPHPWTLAITFDDGYRDNFMNAAPLLREHGLPACFFLSAGYIGTARRFPWDVADGVNTENMSWEEVRQLAVMGFELGAHTVNHVDMGTADRDTARWEIFRSRRIIENRTGGVAPYFSYPFGGADNHSPVARALVEEAGFACAFLAHGGHIRAGDDPYLLPRVPISYGERNPRGIRMELESFFDWQSYLRPPAANRSEAI
jgi:peptidoglycan/xylan/chitin deacetylase (PgdA/CDA1 family)